MAAGWLVMLALFMKLAVPAGFMPVFAGGSVRIELCSGNGPEMMAGMADHADHAGKHRPPGAPGEPCGFAGHAPPAMAGADPILLVAAIAFVFAAVFTAPARRRPQAPPFLRPHPRGPPAPAFA